MHSSKEMHFKLTIKTSLILNFLLGQPDTVLHHRPLLPTLQLCKLLLPLLPLFSDYGFRDNEFPSLP